MNIVFMGSSDFGIAALERLIDAGHRIAAVVSTPSKPQGRGLKLIPSPVTLHAQRRGVGPVLLPPDLRSDDFIRLLTDVKADLFVVVAFRLLPPRVFALPPLGTINIHASLLPRFRGPAPIQRAIENGERETGVTIFRIDTGVDTGNILLQRTLTIGDQETTPQLAARLSVLGADALVEAIEALARNAVTPQTQDNTLATRAPKLVKSEGIIDWDQPAMRIFNKIRAFKPFPGTVTKLDTRTLGIERALPLEKDYQKTPGTICAVAEESFDVQCAHGALRIIDVKPEGKKQMSAAAFLRGTPLQEGILLG